MMVRFNIKPDARFHFTGVRTIPKGFGKVNRGHNEFAQMGTAGHPKAPAGAGASVGRHHRWQPSGSPPAMPTCTDKNYDPWASPPFLKDSKRYEMNRNNSEVMHTGARWGHYGTHDMYLSTDAHLVGVSQLCGEDSEGLADLLPRPIPFFSPAHTSSA